MCESFNESYIFPSSFNSDISSHSTSDSKKPPKRGNLEKMERSRSKCSYHPYDRHKSGSPPSSDRRQHHRHSSNSRPLPPPPLPPSSSHARNNSHPDFNANSFLDSRAITFFKILCPNSRIGSIIGKSGSIIRSFRSKSGARINIRPLVLDDGERIIDISDDCHRKYDSPNSHCSPAQEALLMIHDHIVDKTDNGDRGKGEKREREGKVRDWDRVTTRLVVPKIHIGCLMGKGGKIIEQMRIETSTNIRILPKNQYTPQCVSITEEIVQVLANADAGLV